MDAELEIRRLQRRVQELEQENAELRAQLAAFGLSSSAQGKAGDTVFSAAQMPSNTAATLDAPAPNTVTPSHNRQSIPPARSAPLPVARTSSPAEKIRLFRSLFRGRTDVYALRWHSEKAQKSGYSPVCANEWRPGLCEKGRVPCAKCPNRALLDALAAVPAEQPLAVVAIGKYAGEGVDLPRLDALLLTMPVVWKGTLTQYTGRLHRAAPGKREVSLYDYVDLRVPLLEQQYRKRLRSYAALAYTVRGTAEKPESSEQTAQSEAAVFVSREQFSQRFAADLEGATREVLLCVPSLSARSVQRMIPLLQRLQHKGGEVRIYLPDPAQFRADIQPKITANAAALQRAGIPVMFCPNRLPNFCILDQRLVWYGSLNPLGRMPDGESCLRMDAPDVAAELTEFLRGKREGA